MVTKKKQLTDILLGTFVVVGIVAFIVIVFLIGRERRMFDKTVPIEAHFPNVAGLSVGADVMLAGVVVGHVSSIRFPILKQSVPGLSRDVTVVMDVSERAISWIREDSVARIDSKGLLGDKIINISIGSAELPEVHSGSMLKSTASVDFNKALQQAQEILENVTETVADARDIFKGFTREGGDKALADSVKSIQKMLEEVEKGDGVLHALIYDKDAGKDSKESIKLAKKTLAQVDKLALSLEKVFTQAQSGPGLLHTLLYDQSSSNIVTNLNKTILELNDIIGAIKDGDGIAHDLIYSDNGQFVKSLNQAAGELEEIVTNVKSGQGTLGLLLKDPSIYNELYGLIGNLRRNRLLKAIIRHGISSGD